MRSEDIFAIGLGLQSPWKMKSVSFENGKEIHIHIDFSRGSRFVNDKGDEFLYYTENKIWHHLNFF